jgi:hypothetical protein
MAFPVAALLSAGMDIINKVIPDPIKQAEARARLVEIQQKGELQEIEASMSVIVAEANSEHWVVASWRPITMLTFTAIIANNYILYPYLSLFWEAAPMLALPSDLWDLLKIGLGGYVVGRSTEKTVKAWKS